MSFDEGRNRRLTPSDPFAGKSRRQRRGAVSPASWIFLISVLLSAALLLGAGSTPPQPQELRATLENGLKVVIVRNALSPVATTVVNYLVGSEEAPEGFPGMAHAQEHMMFRGSPALSAAQLADISAAMGGSFDADTQQSVTQYFFTVPAEDLDVALHIEAIRMRGVLDSEELWAKERGAIEQEVAQDLSSPEYIFYTKLLAAIFRGTPYAVDALGTRPSFEKTTGTMLKRFHDTWYVPNNAILVIVGDVQPEKTMGEVKKYFGDIPPKKLPERPAINLQPVKPETYHLETDRPYGTAVVAFRTPGYESPDFAAVQVLADVMSSQRGELYALVPDGKALDAGFSVSTLPKGGIGYASAAFPQGGDAESLLRELRKIVDGIAKKGVVPDLVEASKRRTLADLEFQKNSISGSAMAWSQALAVEGRPSPEEDVRAVARVTVADVNRVAREVLDLNHAITAVLKPAPSGKPVSSKGFGGKETFAPPQSAAVKLPEWAEKSLTRLSLPTSVVHPVSWILPNGLKLIVQQESISNTVGLFGHIKNNPTLQEPQGQEGVGDLLDQLFPFGSATLDRLALQKALDDIGASASAGTGFSLQVLAEHFERGVEILAENELRPALPEKAFQIVQKQSAQAVAGQLKSPTYLAGRALKSALFPKGDPTLRQATPESISSLKIQDVKEYYKKVFRPDLTTIVVIGNVTPERAKSVIEKRFGGWAAEGPKPETDLPPVPLNGPGNVAVPNASRVQDSVILAETLGLTRSHPDYYALQLGNHVLGGAFYATRLYRDLRENSGLVYYVSSSFDVGKTRSLYAVTLGCDPPKIQRAKAIVEGNLREMQSKPVSSRELQQAKALLLREIPLSEASVDDIAMGLISRSVRDLPLDESIRAARRYLNLTAEEVQAAFAKWVRPADLVQVTEGPPRK